MGDLTKNLSRWEYACNCGCGYDTVDHALVMFHQQIRDHFKRAVTVTSGCRCAWYNGVKRGKRKSTHLKGRGGDIVVDGVSPTDVGDYCEEIGVPGIGVYDDFIHTDSRSNGTARWKG